MQDELVRALMTTLYCVRWFSPVITTEVAVSPSTSTVPLGHSTRYFKGQAKLEGGGDQVTITSGGVAIMRLGAVGAPGQAGGRMGGG